MIFRIPFLSLFTAKRFWQGLIYSLFMTLGKLLVGFWIPLRDMVQYRPSQAGDVSTPRAVSGEIRGESDAQAVELDDYPVDDPTGTPSTTQRSSAKGLKGLMFVPDRSSLAPGLLLGTALVARGEVG
jgi:hypothetical protein